ncbi:hypothetical protein [Amycolatopsis sp. cmx-8-4]|uniref:hypothetical protein n=1 Tax=Amycolatopsis sp. cmx-8-4 TaxID=2790947 RepID=UPI0039783BEF
MLVSLRKMGRITVISLALASAVSVAGTAPMAAAAGASRSVVKTEPGPGAPSVGRQLLGRVSGSAYFEASLPAAGGYAIEYDITATAFFDTYVDEVELGYVGGPAGVYRTRSLTLTKGGHLVHVVGPEGSGMASVYLVRVS